MKTGTLKTIGAAALGVAFAAAAAGTASAAPATLAAPGLDSLTGQLPVGHVSGLVPGTGQAAGAVKGVLHSAPSTLNGANGGGLIGGLPKGGLPVSGLPLSG